MVVGERGGSSEYFVLQGREQCVLEGWACMLFFMKLLETVEESANKRQSSRALVKVRFCFRHSRCATGGTKNRLGGVDLVLLVAGRKPLEEEFGYESFFIKGHFAQSGMVSFPIDKVYKPSIPLVVINEPFEEVFGASRFTKVCCIVTSDSNIVDP
jgi:hypothetical protein